MLATFFRKKIISSLLFSIAFVFNSAAGIKDYSKIDVYARATPKSKEVAVETLVKYLIIPAKGDSEKVRSLFSWITSHIRYDWEAYENNAGQWQTPMVTMQTHKGVCENYSDLFTAMCSTAGLPAQTIQGYAKSTIDNSWMMGGFGSTNHAWNVVKVSGRWELMDVTWAENTGSETFFMAKPLPFRRDHLPADDQWQLTKDTLSLDEYEHMPLLKEGYDALHISHLTPMLSYLEGKKKITIAFDSKENLRVITKVDNYDHTDHSLPKYTPTISHSGSHYTITLEFLTEGAYWVNIENDSFLGGIATYVVDTR